jgi:hypothetical protein
MREYLWENYSMVSSHYGREIAVFVFLGGEVLEYGLVGINKEVAV